MSRFLAAPLDHQAKRQIQRAAGLPDVRRLIVLPDAHAGHVVCNGCVLATESAIYPDAVGRDIGCGYAAARLTGDTAWCEDRELLREILRRIGAEVAILRRQPVEYPLSAPDSNDLSNPSLRAITRRLGRVQLGTLGRGNHFIECQRDEEGTPWLMIHTGSRGIGEAIHEHHTARAARRVAGLPILMRGTSEGESYLADTAWAQRWACINRRTILLLVTRAIEELTDASLTSNSIIDSAHNTISVERHGTELLVHRKSAARAVLHEPVLIAGSAATYSVHAEGLSAELTLGSSVHGAGRLLPRSVASRRFGPRQVERQYGDVVFDVRHAARLGEEAPQAYRDLRATLRAQKGIIRVTRRLTPLLSFKGV